MNGSLSLTTQELNVIRYLSALKETEIPWVVLAQFSKDPKTVKYKSIQKVISEIKRKYKGVGIPLPFTVSVTNTVEAATVQAPATQTLVQVKRTPGGNTVIVGSNTQSAAQIDFALNLNTKSVKTKFGSHKLNDNEWYMFKFLHENAGTLIKISTLRDKVMFPNYGSKLPARWYDSIMRVINNMRRAIPGLDKRLLTVKSDETCYLFQ